MKKLLAGLALGGGGCLVVVLLVLLSGAISFGVGYLIGLLLHWLAGEAILAFLTGVFPALVVTEKTIPITVGVIAVIASFFKSSTTVKND